jgi:hypothetical protein
MAKINLKDSSGNEWNLDPDPLSLFGKYVVSHAAVEIAAQSGQEFSKSAGGGPSQIKDFTVNFVPLSLQQPVALGTNGVELTIAAKTSGCIALTSGRSILDKELYDKVDLADDQKYITTTLKATLDADVTGKQGDLKFGFDAGTDATLTSSQPVEATEPLVPAIEKSLSNFILAADLEDIIHMAPQTVASFEGNGTLKLSFEIDAPISPLQLATVPTGTANLGIAVDIAPKIGVSVAPSLTGGYKVQVTKVDPDTVLLAYSKQAGRKLEATFAASAGISVTAGGNDLLQQFLNSVFPQDAKLPENDLKALNIGDDEIKVMENAIKGGIQKSLQLSLQEQLDASTENGNAFLYRIKLSALDAASKRAINHAIDGDLSLMKAGKALAGIENLRCIVTTTKEQCRAFKVNLFGILNAGTLHDYLQNTDWITDPDTHSVTIIDTVGASEVGYDIRNLAQDSRKLHRILADGALATCAYRASKTGYQPAMTVKCWAFDLTQSAGWGVIQSYLNVASALKIDVATASQKAANTHQPFGKTVFNAEVDLADAQIDHLFFDQYGNPHLEAEYEYAGRQALLKTLPVDLDSRIAQFRRAALNNADLWRQMRDAGSYPNVRTVLAASFGQPAGFEVLACDVYGDYLIVEWWASAMTEAAQALSNLRRFLAANKGIDPHNNSLSKLRGELNKQLKAALSAAHDRFDQPWGVVAMDDMAGQKVQASVVISSPELSLDLRAA